MAQLSDNFPSEVPTNTVGYSLGTCQCEKCTDTAYSCPKYCGYCKQCTKEPPTIHKRGTNTRITVYDVWPSELNSARTYVAEDNAAPAEFEDKLAEDYNALKAAEDKAEEDAYCRDGCEPELIEGWTDEKSRLEAAMRTPEDSAEATRIRTTSTRAFTDHVMRGFEQAYKAGQMTAAQIEREREGHALLRMGTSALNTALRRIERQLSTPFEDLHGEVLTRYIRVTDLWAKYDPNKTRAQRRDRRNAPNMDDMHSAVDGVVNGEKVSEDASEHAVQNTLRGFTEDSLDGRSEESGWNHLADVADAKLFYRPSVDHNEEEIVEAVLLRAEQHPDLPDKGLKALRELLKSGFLRQSQYDRVRRLIGRVAATHGYKFVSDRPTEKQLLFAADVARPLSVLDTLPDDTDWRNSPVVDRALCGA